MGLGFPISALIPTRTAVWPCKHEYNFVKPVCILENVCNLSDANSQMAYSIICN